MARYLAHLVRVTVVFAALLSTPFALAEQPGVEFFAAHSKISDVVISPDGKHIAFNYEEDNNEVKLAIATSDLSRIVHVVGYGKDHHMSGHFWSSNERIVTWEYRNTGWLDGSRQFAQLLGLDYDGRNRETLFAPQFQGMQIYSRLKNDPDHILVGTRHFYDEGQVSLNRLNVHTGELDFQGGIPTASAETEIVDVDVDVEGEMRVALERDRGKDRYDDEDDSYAVHYRTESGEWRKLPVAGKRGRAEFRGLGFSSDDRKYYFLSDFDVPQNDPDERGTLALFEFDFGTEEVRKLFRHPDVDIQTGVWGPDNEVLGVRYEPGYPTMHYVDEESPYTQLLKSLQATFPNQAVRFNSFTDDGSATVVHVYSDRNPGMYYLYREGRLKHVASSFPDIDSDWLGSTEAFTMKARDGVKLYGLLTLPPGGKDEDLPLIVHPHGGPHGPYDQWGYNARVQMLASHGYAVLQVNFRGSGGYGKDFERSGYGKWGREMQDDLTDATLWAVQQGIADRNRICIFGGSYGGYATLQALVREPDLYACGIGVAGVYSLPMMWKKGDMREQGARRYSDVFLERFIGKDETELKQYSPAYNVDRIKAALFLIHGSEDVRVPIEQAEFLREQLEAAGKPFEWMVRKEGHGFTKVENRVEQFNAMLAFLEKHIGVNQLAAKP